jgi:hypothetical protein
MKHYTNFSSWMFLQRPCLMGIGWKNMLTYAAFDKVIFSKESIEAFNTNLNLHKPSYW